MRWADQQGSRGGRYQRPDSGRLDITGPLQKGRVLINPLSVSAAQSMSASLRKRPKCCVAAKRRSVPILLPGCRRDFRVKMWGASSPDDKLTGDLGNVIETT